MMMRIGGAAGLSLAFAHGDPLAAPPLPVAFVPPAPVVDEPGVPPDGPLVLAAGFNGAFCTVLRVKRCEGGWPQFADGPPGPWS
jgi:hypothetical protein